MIDESRAASGVRCSIQSADTHNGNEARHGEGIKGRGKARRGENVRRGVVVRVQLLARAYI